MNHTDKSLFELRQYAIEKDAEAAMLEQKLLEMEERHTSECMKLISERDELQQQVAGGSWAFVKQIEELQHLLEAEKEKLRIAVECLCIIETFCPEGRISIVPQKALQQATKMAREALARISPASESKSQGEG